MKASISIQYNYKCNIIPKDWNLTLSAKALKLGYFILGVYFSTFKRHSKYFSFAFVNKLCIVDICTVWSMLSIGKCVHRRNTKTSFTLQWNQITIFFKEKNPIYVSFGRNIMPRLILISFLLWSLELYYLMYVLCLV